MRILIPILLLAGLGVGYLAFRRDTEPAPTGTGPANREATASTPRDPLELERGSVPAARTTAATEEAKPVAGATPAVAVAAVPEAVTAEVTQDPTFTNGVTTGPVATKLQTKDDEKYYVEKYRDSPRAVRVQAYDSLRVAFDIESASDSKDSALLAAEMKREMAWLQENFEPQTP